tara:strand:+ start:362 stop:2332 length:1971 start_codon:yes stop_codon:yes gene_type:complete
MDYETNVNCFLGVFEDYKTDETHVFTCSKLRNDIHEFIDFLESHIENGSFHISYNGLAFDAQITEFILVNKERLSILSGEEIGRFIYRKAQDCINRSRNQEFQEWYDKTLSIKQIDVFKLNHWDNASKRSSLKWIQCSMRWKNVQDMPIDHTEEINTIEQLKQIASYCRNDVASTKKIMELSSGEIKLRMGLTEKYNIILWSASEPRIAKELFADAISKQTGINKYELKDMRTNRTTIVVKDLILDYLQFKSPVFTNLKNKFSTLRLDANNLKGSFHEVVKYRGVEISFGLGGVHGAKRGIYEPEEYMTIVSSDVVSYYPNLGIKNEWHPAHLPKKDFCEQYEWFFNERKKIPKSNPQNYVYKIVLNSAYGLSNDVNSFLYDPEFTMRVTINGQLSLMLLSEMICENIPGAVPLMYNTDGVETIIPKKYFDKYIEICNEWETITKLSLEHDEYSKLMLPDCNNYIGVFKKKEIHKDLYDDLIKKQSYDLLSREGEKYYLSPVKLKGRFEIDKKLHKNCSYKVVSEGLYNFFVKGIEPEETVASNKNILDYCGQVKIKGAWTFNSLSIDKGNYIQNKLQKTNRYLITNKGSKIVKINNDDGRQIQVEAGIWLQTLFNVYEEKKWTEYDINEKYYIQKIKKEIKDMSPELFINQYKIF